jgi:hypothetical protein
VLSISIIFNASPDSDFVLACDHLHINNPIKDLGISFTGLVEYEAERLARTGEYSDYYEIEVWATHWIKTAPVEYLG